MDYSRSPASSAFLQHGSEEKKKPVSPSLPGVSYHPSLRKLVIRSGVGNVANVNDLITNLADQGFTTANLIKTSTVAMLVEYVPGVRPGTAHALITTANTEGEEGVPAPPIPQPSISASDPIHTLAHSAFMMSLEKRRIAGNMPAFPTVTDSATFREKVTSWGLGVAAHVRIWSVDGAATLLTMLYAKYDRVSCIVESTKMNNDDNIYMGNLLVQATSNNTKLQNMLPTMILVSPKGLQIMHTILNLFAKNDDTHANKVRRKFCKCGTLVVRLGLLPRLTSYS